MVWPGLISSSRHHIEKSIDAEELFAATAQDGCVRMEFETRVLFGELAEGP